MQKSRGDWAWDNSSSSSSSGSVGVGGGQVNGSDTVWVLRGRRSINHDYGNFKRISTCKQRDRLSRSLSTWYSISLYIIAKFSRPRSLIHSIHFACLSTGHINQPVVGWPKGKKGSSRCLLITIGQAEVMIMYFRQNHNTTIHWTCIVWHSCARARRDTQEASQKARRKTMTTTTIS